MSSSPLWDKAVEPIVKALKVYGGRVEVPGMVRLEYDCDEITDESKWVQIYGMHEPDDNGEYVVSVWNNGAWFGVYADKHLFKAVCRFADELEYYE